MARITKPVEERRREIIDAARQLFIDNGFEKTQVSDISSKIKVAQGLIYHYFKSKTEILYAVIDEMATEQMETIKQAIDKNDGSALDSLSLLLGSQPTSESYDKLIQCLIRDRAIIEYCSKKMTVSALPLLRSLIEQGNADGSWDCEYPNETAIFILHGFSGIIQFFPPHDNNDARKRIFKDIIFRVLGANPSK